MKHRTFAFGLGVCFLAASLAHASNDFSVESLVKEPATPALMQLSPAPAAGPASDDPLRAISLLHQEVLGAASTSSLPSAPKEEIAREVLRPSIPVATQKDLGDKSIKSRVKALRQERLQSMPYLSRGVIRDAINSKRVENRS